MPEERPLRSYFNGGEGNRNESASVFLSAGGGAFGLPYPNERLTHERA